jgi:parvulin-like peptidyl-prolyl isomerase
MIYLSKGIFMKRIIFLLILLTLTAVYGFSQAGLQTVATVNLIRTESITRNQLNTEIENVEKATGRPLNPAEKRQVLDAMINERLVLQAAERDRIIVSDNEVNQHFQELRGMLAQNIGRQPTDAEFTQAVRNEFGMEVQAYRDQFRKQLISQKYLMFKKESLLNTIKPPTEAEIAAEYTLLKGELVRPETVRFSMILIPYGADAASRSKAKETADRLVREIGTNPTKFDEVAARSVAPNSGYQAGDAGYLPRNQEARNIVGTDLMNAAFSLRQGQISSLIEGFQGFNIIKITENYAQKSLELDDILQLGTRFTVKDFIGQRMLEHRQQAILAQATEELIRELRTGRSFQIIESNLNF